MLIPFVMTMLNYSDTCSHLWIFYKFLDQAKEHHWPIIAQEEYFTPPSVFKAQGRWEASDEKRCKAVSGYSLPKDEDLDKITRYVIPFGLEEQLIREKGSRNDAFAFLLTERWKPLEDLLDGFFAEIVAKNDEPNAVLTLCSYPSLTAVAEKYHIPVLNYELGPLREPAYFTRTAYLDSDFLYGRATSEQRFEKFQQERKEREIPILSKKEILAIMLAKEKLAYLDLYDAKPVYEMGVALGYAYWPIQNSRSHLMDDELLYYAEKYYSMPNLLIRKHPGDPFRAQYPRYFSAMDGSADSAEFVLKCKRVCSVSSNVTLEAMLFGRTGYLLSGHPVSFMAKKDIADRKLQEVSDEALTFFVFSYLVPNEFVTDWDYLKWRLTNPPEEEIMKKHLEFYLNKKGIPLDVISLSGKERLQKLLFHQGHNSQRPFHNIEKNTKYRIEPRSEEAVKAQQQDELIALREIKTQYEALLQSRSWKLTAPLRKLKHWLIK